MSEREKKVGTVPAATASTERREIAVVRMLGGGTRQVRSLFHFDEVLTSFSTQSEVFAATLDPLVDEVLAGYEATAFAYGQTGTGKTYTMEGDLESDAARGLVPRTAAAIIDRLSKGKYAEYSISCSYLEIYNEELSDLLAPVHIPQPKLDLKDVGSGRGVVCTGLSEVPVTSLADILELVRSAQERRRVAETRINARSSRSHCIFTLKVKCRRVVAAGELENSGRLHLVDLAGSECAKKAAPIADEGGSGHGGDKKSGVSDEDRERKNINQSLLTLGRVITALRDGTGRVPYRDSKLTRLLQDALGGRCKTVVIATISPALNAVEETISTLSYAEQASGVRNRPVATSLLRTIRLAANSGGAIPDMGVAFTGGGCGSSSDWAELEMKIAYLNQEVEEAQAALAVQYREVEEQLERANAAEGKLRQAEAALDTAERAREEQTFLATSFASFADGRVDAAAALSSALDASLAHGQDLGRRLLQRTEWAVAARRQARESLEEAARQGGAVKVSTAKAAAGLETLAREAYSAHRTSSDAAAELTQEQEHALDGLLTAAHGEAQCLEKTLAATACEAKAAVDEAEAACGAASAAAEAAMQEAAQAAEAGGAEVRATVVAGEDAGEQRAAASRAAAAAAKSSLDAAVAATVADATAARSAARTAHDEQVARIRSDLQEPVASLGGALERDGDELTRHRETLSQLQAEEEKNKDRETARRQELLDTVAKIQDAFKEATNAGQESLRQALGQLLAVLTTRGSAAAAALGDVASELAAARAALQEASSCRSAAAAEAAGEADTLLAASWREQRAVLEALATTLTGAAAQQRAANAGNALEAEATAASAAQAAALAAAVETLAAARATIAGEVQALQAQRAAEAAAVAALTSQREALAADAAELRAAVQALRGELAEGRGKLDNLATAQTRTREKVLQAVSEALKSELASLGAELQAGVTDVTEQLQGGEQAAGKICEQVAAAESRSADVVAKTMQIVQDWSKDIGASCDKIEVGQQQAAEGADAVTAASTESGRCFSKLAAACSQWGVQCDEVASSIDVGLQKQGALCAALDKLAPEWQQAKAKAEAVTQAWVQDCGEVGASLGTVAGHREAAEAELTNLTAEVTAHHTSAEQTAAQWQQDSQAHSGGLGDLASLCDRSTAAGLEEARERGQAVAALGDRAEALTASCRRRRGELEAVAGAVAAELETLAPAFERHDAAVAAAAGAAQALVQEAGGALEAAAGSVDDLRAEQARTCGSVLERVAGATEAVAAAATRAVASECDQRAAVGEFCKRAKALWARSTEERQGSLKALSAAADAARDAAKKAKLRGCDRVLAELERGERTEVKAIAAAQNLASGTAAALDNYLDSLRSALRAEPLAAYEEKAEAVPSCPKAALRPEVQLLRRPAKEELLAELRAAGASAFLGKENTPEACCPAKTEAAAVRPAAAEPTKDTVKEPRVALAERNAPGVA